MCLIAVAWQDHPRYELALIAITGISQDGGEALSFGEAAWASLMRTLDAGTMGGDTGWVFRISAGLLFLAVGLTKFNDRSWVGLFADIGFGD